MGFELYIVFAITAIILWMVYDKQKFTARSYPPGPLRLPIVGNLPHLVWESFYPAEAFLKLAKKHGDVYHLRLGQRDAIVFNSQDSIKYILNHEDCQDRTQDMSQLIREYLENRNLGIGFGNGIVWQTLRQFTIRTLRNFGFGKSSTMDEVINEEAQKLVSHLKSEMAKNPEGIPNIKNTFGLCTINILWKFLTGYNYELGDTKMLQLAKISSDLFKSSNFGIDISTFFPITYSWFPSMRGSIIKTESSIKLRDFLQGTIDHHREVGEYKTTQNCYIDAFLAKIDEEEKEGIFTPVQLFTCIVDLFEAGGDTASSALSFAVLYMLVYPEVQEKIQKEIDQYLGQDEMITMASKSKLPFTSATILECLRFCAVIPIDIPRVPKKDLFYKNFYIKKNMILIPNLYAVFFDERTWGDPYNFRPERFLNKEGTALDSKITSDMMHFGHGPRYCLGSGLGETTMFIFLATILRNFKIEKVSDGLSIQPQLGLSYSPKPFKAKFITRR